jgi:hypothetical protein
MGCSAFAFLETARSRCTPSTRLAWPDRLAGQRVPLIPLQDEAVAEVGYDLARADLVKPRLRVLKAGVQIFDLERVIRPIRARRPRLPWYSRRTRWASPALRSGRAARALQARHQRRIKIAPIDRSRADVLRKSRHRINRDG